MTVMAVKLALDKIYSEKEKVDYGDFMVFVSVFRDYAKDNRVRDMLDEFIQYEYSSPRRKEILKI